MGTRLAGRGLCGGNSHLAPLRARIKVGPLILGRCDGLGGLGLLGDEWVFDEGRTSLMSGMRPTKEGSILVRFALVCLCLYKFVVDDCAMCSESLTTVVVLLLNSNNNNNSYSIVQDDKRRPLRISCTTICICIPLRLIIALTFLVV